MWPTALLARRQPRLGALETVVGGVANDMDERIGEPLDHRLVELGFLAFGIELDLLVEIVGEVVDEAAEAAKQRSDGQHADAHHRVAQRGGEPFDFLGDAFGVGADGGELGKPRLGDHQLADAIHHFVEPLGLHADRCVFVDAALGGDVGGARRRLAAGRRGRGSAAGCVSSLASDAAAAAATSSMLRSISLATKMKTSSMSLRGCAVVSSTSQEK